MAEYFHLGKLTGVHGLKGQLLMRHAWGDDLPVKKIRTVFIELSPDNLVPWFIEKIQPKNKEECFIKLEGVNTREEATKLAQKKTWVLKKEVDKLLPDNAPAKLIGYKIIQKRKILGQVQEVFEQASQLICRTEIEGKEVLIPLNDHSLRKIIHDKKEIHVLLPEGLLDIYLAG
jgi:16S rRNA processing protein RimM